MKMDATCMFQSILAISMCLDILLFIILPVIWKITYFIHAVYSHQKKKNVIGTYGVFKVKIDPIIVKK